MKLEIKNSYKRYEVVANTSNATYNTVYSITVQGVNKVIKVSSDVMVNNTKIGTLEFSGENISTSGFPFSVNFMTYISDFSELVNQVKDLILLQEETHEEIQEETLEETLIETEEYEQINKEEE